MSENQDIETTDTEGHMPFRHLVEDGDDTEGHGGRYGGLEPEPEDTEGHKLARVVRDDDDTEGHGLRRGLRDEDKDTEGHGLRRGLVEDEDEDTEGHGVRRF